MTAPAASTRHDVAVTGPAVGLVTVVVPALDEQDAIDACLDSILAQDHPHLEVLVVDGGSADRTCELVRARMQHDARVGLLHNRARTVPAALNQALRAARGTWLVRVDAHATVPPDYVRRAVAHLATGEWGGVGGRKDGVGRTAAGRAIAVAMASRFGVGGSTYHHGTTTQEVDHVPFGAYPVALARALGGWDERFPVNQDYEFDYRLRQGGHRLLFDPSLVIAWECRQSLRGLYGQYRRYGRGKVDVALEHPRSIRLRHLAAPAVVAALWLAPVLRLLGCRRLPALIAGSYGAALAGASTLRAREVAGLRAKAQLPAAFVAMHVGWGAGFWRGLLARIRS